MGAGMSERFLRVPEYLNRSDIKLGDRIVAARILDLIEHRGGEASPSIRWLASELNANANTINRAISRLLKAGILSAKSDGNGHRATYRRGTGPSPKPRRSVPKTETLNRPQNRDATVPKMKTDRPQNRDGSVPKTGTHTYQKDNYKDLENTTGAREVRGPEIYDLLRELWPGSYPGPIQCSATDSHQLNIEIRGRGGDEVKAEVAAFCKCVKRDRMKVRRPIGLFLAGVGGWAAQAAEPKRQRGWAAAAPEDAFDDSEDLDEIFKVEAKQEEVA